MIIDASVQNKPVRVTLKRETGLEIGSTTLKYDGSFVFEGLEAGNYLVVIEKEDSPTVARPVQLKAYPSPKTTFLQVRLGADGSATIREIVKEYTHAEIPERDETASTVSKKALSAFQKASAESAKGNTAQAIEFLQKAVKEDPKFYEAYNNLGVQYQKLNEWDKAVEAFQQSITIRNDSAKPHINLGNLYLALQKPDKAADSFKQALVFDSNSVAALWGLGQIYFRKQEYGPAAEHLDMATHLAPRQSRDAFLLLAQIHILQQEFPKARHVLEALLDYFPADPEAQKILATLPASSRVPSSSP